MLKKSFDLVVSNPPIRAGKNVVHGIVDGSFYIWKLMVTYGLLSKQGKPVQLVNKNDKCLVNCQLIW